MIVDDDIARDTYERFAVDGHVYIVIFYKNGQPETRIVKKELWEQILASFHDVS